MHRLSPRFVGGPCTVRQPRRVAGRQRHDEPKAARQGFRRDVEGLRAVAILLVVLYHAHLGVPGGYVGVDVFFVISGFLITSQLARELMAERTSLVHRVLCEKGPADPPRSHGDNDRDGHCGRDSAVAAAGDARFQRCALRGCLRGEHPLRRSRCQLFQRQSFPIAASALLVVVGRRTVLLCLAIAPGRVIARLARKRSSVAKERAPRHAN